jgi:hypothetical protein
MGACMHIACHADVARVPVDSADMCAHPAQTNVLGIYTADVADVTVRRGSITGCCVVYAWGSEASPIKRSDRFIAIQFFTTISI